MLMKRLKLTFYNTKPERFGEYTLFRSTTEKKAFELSYNTDSSKRALSLAKRKRRKIIAENPELGANTRLEFI